MKNNFYLFLVLLAPASLSTAFAVTPMWGYISLVAGEGDAGLRDGEFQSALFNQPQALALNADGTLLFVTDYANHAIRAIDLSDNNKVSTLAGTGQKGKDDGDFKSAGFNGPSLIAVLPHDRLVVYDSGNGLFRLLDLAAQRVSTLHLKPKSGPGDRDWKAVSDLAYVPKENALYFSMPGEGAVMRVDPQSLETFQVPIDVRLPHPTALGVYQGKLCAADRDLPTVYQVVPSTEDPAARPAVLTELGKGSGIVSLCSSGKKLYCLQKEGYPWSRVTPDPGPVKIMSVWGDLLEKEDPELGQLLYLKGPWVPPAGLAADPNGMGTFYAVLPEINCVLSLKDYDFDRYKNSDDDEGNGTGLTDFNYPLVKQSNSFRILEIGDSRLFFEAEAEKGKRWPWGFNRMETSPKREELLLNTLASLNDERIHYEVLHSSAKRAIPTYLRAYYVAPKLVQNFDADLVLVFFPLDLEINFYLEHPYGPEKLPVLDLDPEFILKPIEERLKKDQDEDLTEFYHLCVKHQINAPGSKVLGDLPPLVADPKMREELLKIAVKPLKRLADKLKTMRTKEGKPVQLGVVFFPIGNIGGPDILPTEPYRLFYQDACREAGIPLCDLTDAVVATRFSYFPSFEPYGYRHFNHNGHGYFADLVVQELIKEKLVPLGQKAP